MDIHFQSITEIGRKLRSEQISSLALTELMLQRIERHDRTLNAFITVTADLARKQAKQADQELSSGRDRGPLHGIPIAIKDLFETKDIRTTCGSEIYKDWVPEQDATAVKRLRDAGSVLLGKTGLHELAYGHTSDNKYFGAIQNPWAQDHHPGGSSGGSAAAVAAGLAYAALGTDTGCSIRQPAHCCGIVGFKPSFGLASKAGVFPLTWSMDHIGPMARSAKDASLLLDVIAGGCPDDPYSLQQTVQKTTSSNRCELKGLRIGVVRRYFFEGQSDVLGVTNQALAELAGKGAELIELDIPDLEEAFDAIKMIFAEALAVHQIKFDSNPELFSEEIAGKLEGTRRISAAEYANAQKFRKEFTARVEHLFDRCDILAAPTATTATVPIINIPRDHGRNAWKNTAIFDFTGQPSISIPCGFTENRLPVGLMLSGKFLADQRVLDIASAIETATLWQATPPQFE